MLGVWTLLPHSLLFLLPLLASEISAATVTLHPQTTTTYPFMAAPTVASQYTLTTSTSLPFPTTTLSNTDTQAFLADWSLSKGRIQNGASRLAFVADPFPNSSFPTDDNTSVNHTAPVLQVTYPQGEFGAADSGSQMYSLWNSSTPFQSMLLTYDVAFDANFPWVQGGKLPGLRGGADPNSCSGGSESTGDCFSTRIMWRKQAAGEAYSYMLTSNNLCSSSDIICNSDFGVSIHRGAFSFQAGQWNRVTVLVQLNSAPNVANGLIQVYYNDIKAIDQPNLQFSNVSGLTIGGAYISTFYGGDDATWAPTIDTHTYFRNFQLWGGSAPSNLTASAAAPTLSLPWLSGIALLLTNLIRLLV